MALPICTGKMSGRKQTQDTMNEIRSQIGQYSLDDSFKQLQMLRSWHKNNELILINIYSTFI